MQYSHYEGPPSRNDAYADKKAPGYREKDRYEEEPGVWEDHPAPKKYPVNREKDRYEEEPGGREEYPAHKKYPDYREKDHYEREPGGYEDHYGKKRHPEMKGFCCYVLGEHDDCPRDKRYPRDNENSYWYPEDHDLWCWEKKYPWSGKHCHEDDWDECRRRKHCEDEWDECRRKKHFEDDRDDCRRKKRCDEDDWDDCKRKKRCDEDDKKDEKKDDNMDDRKEKEKKPEKEGTLVRLNANTGSAGPLPVITTLFADPIAVVSTSIDTEGMRRANILLTFTSTISLPVGISVTLNFQINRITSEGGKIKVGSTYTFSTLVNILESEAFSFQFFDSNVKPDNYTYSVELSTNSIIDITPGLTINNATLSALAVESC